MESKKVRNIKVISQNGRNYKPTPAIILKGQWLNEMGFEIGDQIKVECENGKLVISLDRERMEMLDAERAFMEAETIERWELTKWDVKDAVSVADGGGMANGDCPFLVKVSIPDLNIRKGAGTNTGKTGRHTGVGVFTVVEVRQGKGSEMGWGRLKSGAGWIALSFCERV